MLGSGERPALGILVLEVLRQQLPDLTPAEWLGLMDRLALIDRMLAAQNMQERGPLLGALAAMVRRGTIRPLGN